MKLCILTSESQNIRRNNNGPELAEVANREETQWQCQEIRRQKKKTPPLLMDLNQMWAAVYIWDCGFNAFWKV